MTDFELAKDKVLMGAERKSMVISNDEKRVTAYHEAGHTLVGLKVPNADPVHKVTIIPRGMALGVTQQLPEGDRHNYSEEYLLGQIAILMGGRIAENTFLGSITTFGKKEEQIFLGREIAQHRDFSEETAIKIDEQVKKIVTAQYDRAKAIIEDNRDTMVRLAECLLERESLDGVEIRRIVAGLTLDEAQPVTDAGSDEDKPQLKEPSARPLKPILPPITGGNPAPA
jgi:cell division protease FtsH